MINLNNIKHQMRNDEWYSDVVDGKFTITWGAYGRQLTVKAYENMAEDDVTYVLVLGATTYHTKDFDEMFDKVSETFLSYYQD